MMSLHKLLFNFLLILGLCFTFVASRTEIEDFPYYVSLRVSGSNSEQHICGGAIIGLTTVLTVAHCVKGIDPNSPMMVLAGSSNTTDGDEYKVVNFIPNNHYEDELLGHDIAVVKIEGDFVYRKEIQPIAIAKKGTKMISGALVDVPGLGYYANVLHSVEIEIQDFDYCKNYYALLNITLDRESQFCAGDLSTITTNFDKGSPLVKDHILLGLASFGNKYVTAHSARALPTVFTDVSKYSAWIQKSAK